MKNSTSKIQVIWQELNLVKMDKKRFSEKFLEISFELKKYIAARLKLSIHKGELPANKYKIDDFIDELYIEAYDNFEKFSSSDEFTVWLIQKVDKILEDTVIEEEFDDFFFKNIDNYTSDEWKSMEENYSSNVDGRPILLEELDNTYASNYKLQDVFIENPTDDLINEISNKLSEEQIHKHIELVCSRLPLNESVIFQQAMILGLSPEMISANRNIEKSQVQKILNSVSFKIQKSFDARYFFNRE